MSNKVANIQEIIIILSMSAFACIAAGALTESRPLLSYGVFIAILGCVAALARAAVEIWEFYKEERDR